MYFLVALISLAEVSPPANASAVTRHRGEIEQWRADRVRRLTAPEGWLSVVGLSWLEEGDNAIGSAASSRIPLSRGKAPGRLGTIQLVKGKTVFQVAPGVAVTHEGEPVRTIALVADAAGEPTVLRHGTLSFYLIRRGNRLGVRVKDSASPALAAFTRIESYPVQPAWRVTARFEPYRPPKKVAIPNIIGTVANEPSPGAVVFTVAGRQHRLDAIEEEGSDELFLIFGDRTNGVETYGAGRFLYAARPGKDGTTVVDFNKAYNPPCAFTAYATCPLPPPQNRLAIRVDAGEKSYGEH